MHANNLNTNQLDLTLFEGDYFMALRMMNEGWVDGTHHWYNAGVSLAVESDRLRTVKLEQCERNRRVNSL